jgi:hypothetical protein
MSAADVVRFEAAAGALLDELGYQRGSTSISEDHLAHAEVVRSRFADEVRLQDRPLPRAWSDRPGPRVE